MTKKNFIKGKTQSGFEFEIEENQLDNYELLEMAAEVDSNPALMPKMFKTLLGEEQLSNLKEHVRNEDGVVTGESMGKEITDIFAGTQELKK